MQVVTANPLSVHLTEICHGLSRLSKIAVLSALAPEFSPQPAVLSAFASEFGPKGDDHRTGGIAPTVRKMGGKGQPLGLAPDGRRKEGDPLAPTLKTPVLESDPKPHADLTFISSEASGGGKRKGAWRGPVDFFDASVASGAPPVVHMQRVRAVGQLLKDADYDVGRLLNQLGSLAYQTGSDQQEEFPQEFVEEMGEDLLQEMREGFRVPTSEVLEEEDPEKRALRLRALAAAGAKGVKGPSARAEFLRSVKKACDRGEAILVPTAVGLKVPGLQLSVVYMVEEGPVNGPKKHRKIQDLSEEIDGLGTSVNEATWMLDAPEIGYGETPLKFLMAVYNALIVYHGGDLAAAKRDVDGAFNRFHVFPGDVAKFAYMVSPGIMAFMLRLPMGWRRSPANMAITTDAIARFANAHSVMEVPEASLELEELHEENFVDTLEGEQAFRGIADSLNEGLVLGEGVRVMAFVDDLLALCLKRHCQGATRLLCWSMEQLYRRVDVNEAHYRNEAMSVKKLRSEGAWQWQIIALGIGYDLLRGEVFVPEARRLKLLNLLETKFGEGTAVASVKDIQRLTGQCQSLALVKPQGRFQISRFYGAITGLAGYSSDKIVLNDDFLEELKGWKKWAENAKPVSLHAVAIRSPTLTGFSDAAGKKDGGMGGYWELGNGTVIWWREIFPLEITDRLTRDRGEERIGDITINDLELAGVIANFVVLRQVLGDEGMRHAVLLSRADNTSAVSWIRKCVSKGRRGRLLLQILEELLEETECNILATFVAGVDNLADLPSRSFTKEFGQMSSRKTEEELAKLLGVGQANLIEHHLEEKMRVRLLGCISTYNDPPTSKPPGATVGVQVSSKGRVESVRFG